MIPGRLGVAALALLAACSTVPGREAPTAMRSARETVVSPAEQTFVCRQIEEMTCPDEEWCADSYHCTLKIWLSSPDPTKGYVGVASQIHGAGDWRVYDTWNPNIYTHAERVGVSGYVFSGHDTRNAGSIGGDFGYVFTEPTDVDSPGSTGIAANVYNAWGDPGPAGFKGGIGASLVLGGNEGTHGSTALLVNATIANDNRWYRVLHAQPNTLHPDTLGAIWFEKSGPANFLTIQPSDDIDNTAMRITDANFSRHTWEVRKSGLVHGSAPYACWFPTFAFVGNEASGLCAADTDTLGLAVDGTAKVLVTKESVTVASPAVFTGGITAGNLGKPPLTGSRAACFDRDGRLFAALGKTCP